MVGPEDVARVQARAWDIAGDGADVDGVLETICAAIGGVKCVASFHAPARAGIMYAGRARVDPALLALLADRFSTPETSPQVAMLPRMRSGSLDHYARYMDDAALKRTAFYQEFWRPSKVGDGGGLMLRLPDGMYAFAAIGCALGRDWLDARERRAGEAMLMAVARAMRTRDAFDRAQARARLDGAEPDAALIFDASGAMRLANAAAEAVFERGALVRFGRRVCPRDPAAAGAFAEGIAGAVGAGTTSNAMLRDGDRLLAARFEPGPCYGAERTALVTLRAARPLDWTADALAATLGLTPREAAVVLALCSGTSTDRIASGMRLRPGSVRLYLKRAFAKLGARNQADLVQRVLRGRAPP